MVGFSCGRHRGFLFSDRRWHPPTALRSQTLMITHLQKDAVAYKRMRSPCAICARDEAMEATYIEHEGRQQ